MANTKSAKKMIRKIARRAIVNRSRKSRIARFTRHAEAALEKGEPAAARAAFIKAESEIMRGASKRIMHKNKAARIVSSLARRLHQMEG